MQLCNPSPGPAGLGRKTYSRQRGRMRASRPQLRAARRGGGEREGRKRGTGGASAARCLETGRLGTARGVGLSRGIRNSLARMSQPSSSERWRTGGRRGRRRVGLEDQGCRAEVGVCLAVKQASQAGTPDPGRARLPPPAAPGREQCRAVLPPPSARRRISNSALGHRRLLPPSLRPSCTAPRPPSSISVSALAPARSSRHVAACHACEPRDCLQHPACTTHVTPLPQSFRMRQARPPVSLCLCWAGCASDVARRRPASCRPRQTRLPAARHLRRSERAASPWTRLTIVAHRRGREPVSLASPRSRLLSQPPNSCTTPLAATAFLHHQTLSRASTADHFPIPTYYAAIRPPRYLSFSTPSKSTFPLHPAILLTAPSMMPPH
ncbi:hypothetical protein B0J12DRAFT_238487 [Macrophomina phaseolina]|uniref:Uncharacterized protein n=1 Tax=Macrophomina phaseolina TaxID=35725 RepID=A0ABQ8GQK0_9PEZI|nr:hypothetical protein B0J12DRAFT_238487 [Macrophomina phaseolina]